MSFFYLVHKEDAEAYDECQKERKDLEKKIEKDYENEKDMLNCTCAQFEHDRDPFLHITPRYFSQYKEIHKKEKTLRTITLFNPTPIDLVNYYTYYRGCRWGEAYRYKSSSESTARFCAGVDEILRNARKV